MKKITYKMIVFAFFALFINQVHAAVPVAATAISPSGTITDNTPDYSWNAVSDSTWYYLWVNDSTGNVIKKWYTAASAGCDSGTGTCSVTPTTTLANGVGAWWVRTWNDLGSGGWSSTMSFTVDVLSPPGMATLFSPEGALTDNTPTYSWSAVSDATWYFLWVHDAAGGEIFNKWYTAEAAGCSSGTGTCNVTPTTALPDGEGYWQIETWNSAGYGAMTMGMDFDVSSGATPLGAATLASPSGAISDNTPEYSWSAVTDATEYRLWVNDSSGNVINHWYSAEEAGCAVGSGSCSVTSETVLADGVGAWWIQTRNSVGAGAWSDAMAFDVSSLTLPVATELVSPSGAINDNTPTYTWTAIANASDYLLWVDDSSGNVINQSFTAVEAGCAAGETSCSITSEIVLADGAGVWWVRTHNAVGNGPWSSVMNFEVTSLTLPGAATLVSPSGSIINNPTPTYTWTAVSNATDYELWVQDNSGIVIDHMYTAAEVSCASGTGNCSITPDTALAEGEGMWMVKTHNSLGAGDWSTSLIFDVSSVSVPTRPTLTSPSGLITDRGPSFIWEAVSGATEYKLWVDDSSGNVVNQWYDALSAGCESGSGTCSIDLTEALANGSGVWWVRAKNTAGQSAWSLGMNFNVDGLAFALPSKFYAVKAFEYDMGGAAVAPIVEAPTIFGAEEFSFAGDSTFSYNELYFSQTAFINAPDDGESEYRLDAGSWILDEMGVDSSVVLSEADTVATLEGIYSVVKNSVESLAGQSVTIDGSDVSVSMPAGSERAEMEITALTDVYYVNEHMRTYGQTANEFFLSLDEVLEHKCGSSYFRSVQDNENIIGISFTCGQETLTSGTLVGVAHDGSTLIDDIGTWERVTLAGSTFEAIVMSVDSQYRGSFPSEMPLIAMKGAEVWQGYFNTPSEPEKMPFFNQTAFDAIESHLAGLYATAVLPYNGDYSVLASTTMPGCSGGSGYFNITSGVISGGLLGNVPTTGLDITGTLQSNGGASGGFAVGGVTVANYSGAFSGTDNAGGVWSDGTCSGQWIGTRTTPYTGISSAYLTANPWYMVQANGECGDKVTFVSDGSGSGTYNDPDDGIVNYTFTYVLAANGDVTADIPDYGTVDLTYFSSSLNLFTYLSSSPDGDAGETAFKNYSDAISYAASNGEDCVGYIPE